MNRRSRDITSNITVNRCETDIAVNRPDEGLVVVVDCSELLLLPISALLSLVLVSVVVVVNSSQPHSTSSKDNNDLALEVEVEVEVDTAPSTTTAGGGVAVVVGPIRSSLTA